MNSSADRNVISGLVDLELKRREDFSSHLLENASCLKSVVGCGCVSENSSRCDAHELQESRYIQYRENWRLSPKRAFDLGEKNINYQKIQPFPLCVDIEIAAVCDLACPFCFRQSIVTADKIMRFEDFEHIINQVAEMKVPSIKLNWRGEPLLHPQIFEMIKLAKKLGILEIIINTNATKLDDETSRRLIESGLDRMIFSFDGGSKETYEKMRPGRFSENNFESVYSNIVNFRIIRDSLGAFWPRTQIQMIVTEETKNEQKKFISLFREHVDFVSVKPYTERGGALTEVPEITRRRIDEIRADLELEDEVEFRWDIEENLYISTGRLPCEQPFQRLMITYDGVVSMCCYDWGSSYPVGYALDRAFEKNRDIEKVQKSIEVQKSGFKLMANAKVAKPLIEIEKRSQRLVEIWNGKEIESVRKAHVLGDLSEVKICKNCKFKETYSWQKIEKSNL